MATVTLSIEMPAHDVLAQACAAAARDALVRAADDLYGDERASGPYAHPLSVAAWLRERADAIAIDRPVE